MHRGLFVTGTDTGVGKTVVSAALLVRYRAAAPLRYWKPIQTGIEQDDDTAEVARLAAAKPNEILGTGVRLPRALSPHLSARLNGTTIDLHAVVEILSTSHVDTPLIVEGAGGALVPVNDTELMTDLIAMLALPVVVVSRSTLGTINHTLLTLEALRRRSVRTAAVVMVGPPNADNRQAIEDYGKVSVIGELPLFDLLTPELLSEWAEHDLDSKGVLLECLK